MSDDARAAAERLITPTAHYGTIEEDVRLVLDIKMVATYTLEAADRQAALALELGRVEAVEALLRQRVWKLRPALAAAVRALRDVIPYFEDSHEGGEIGRIIATGERALTETAGSTTSTTIALDTAPAEAGATETCPDCGHLNHAGRRCLAGCSIWHCSAGRRAVAPGASDAGE